MPDDLTPDSPYMPDMDPEDAAQIAKLAGQSKNHPIDKELLQAIPWQQPGHRDGESYAKIDARFIEKLADIENRLDEGLPLTDAEADYIINRTITGLLKVNKRPALRLKATQLLMQARLKQITSKSVVDTTAQNVDPPLSLPG